MKPPNHGMRVVVEDSFLWFTGYLLYTPTTKAADRRYGLSLRSHGRISNAAERILPTDRITLLGRSGPPELLRSIESP